MMDSQGVASSSMPNADTSVADELHDPHVDGVTSEVARGGDGRGRSGDETKVMTAPGHHSATNSPRHESGQAPEQTQAPEPGSPPELDQATELEQAAGPAPAAEAAPV